MRIGAARKRITIQQATDTQNAYGEPVSAWADLTTVWAQVLPLTFRESILAKQVAAKADTRFLIRYRIGINIKPKMKVVYNGEDYNIESVINVKNENREIELICNRVIP